jgi:mycothiol synthase
MSTAVLTLRAPTDEDVPRLLEIDHAASRERGIEPTTRAEDFAIKWERPGFDRERNARVAQVAGELVGVATVEPYSVQAWGFGYVLPEHRGGGIGRTLVRWMIDTGRAFENVTEFWTGVAAERPEALALVESFGLQHARSWFRMINQAPSGVAPPIWPEGITLRRLEGDEAVDATVRAYDGSFIDHFNYHPAIREEWVHWMGTPDADPDLWFFAYRGDELAGFCICHVPRTGPRRGDLGPIGTLRPFRGIGLGRALLRHGVHEMVRKGATEVTLGVDSENPSGAVRLYSGNGFEVTHEGRSYRLKLS